MVAVLSHFCDQAPPPPPTHPPPPKLQLLQGVEALPGFRVRDPLPCNWDCQHWYWAVG